MTRSIAQTQRIGVPRFLNSQSRHNAYMLLGAFAALALTTILVVYGWGYYGLEQASRPFSPRHAVLKPSGVVGLRLGILGFVLFALVYLYPLRKRWPALGRIGRTNRWMDFHVLLGLTAPVVVTFHSSFKMQGFAGMAYWTMIAMTVSGIIGRYFYAQIPRSIDAAEMSLKEMQETSAQMVEELGTQKMLPVSEIGRLFHLPDSEQVKSMPVLLALLQMTWLDVTRPFKVWALRRRGTGIFGAMLTLGGILPSSNRDLEKAISLASRQTAFAKRILFLSKTQRVFHLWHVIHRPFSLSFALFVIIHVAVVTFLGYY